jgi:hypothetical protein
MTSSSTRRSRIWDDEMTSLRLNDCDDLCLVATDHRAVGLIGENFQ